MSVISATGLTCKFGSFTAVNQVDLCIEPGAVFGLLGPNGAGKTTLLRLISGLLPPTSGQVRVLGLDPHQQRWELRPRLGYMSQQFSLYRELSVRENLEFYARVYGLERKATQQLIGQRLDELGVLPLADTLVENLSGGLRQRVAFAAALLHQPRLVLLDEPTSGVEPEIRRELWQLIYEYAATGAAVLVTTHYMDEAEHCDRLAMMHQGKIVAVGSPAELKESLPKPAKSLMDVFIHYAEGGSSCDQG